MGRTLGRLLGRLPLVVVFVCLPSLGMAQPSPPSADLPAPAPAPAPDSASPGAAPTVSAPPEVQGFDKVLKVDPALGPALALYRQGDYPAAAVAFEKLGRKGSLLAQYYMGEMLSLGLGVKQDRAAAVAWLNEPAKSGLAPAQLVMAEALEASGPQQDFGRAAVLYRLAASYLPVARYRLGLLFMNGRGVDPRPDLAFKLVESAATDGVAEAELVYATMLRDGFGTRPNVVLAMEWFRKAAQKGMPSAQLVMSQAYGVGVGVPKNPALALDWAREAANRGNVDAQLLTGILLARGHGAETDIDQSVYWLEKAARYYIQVGSKNGAILTLVELEKIHPDSELLPQLKGIISPDLK